MKLFPLVLAAIVALPLTAQGQDAAPTNAEPSFVRKSDIDLLSLLPPPPAPGSAREKADLAELHRLQDVRTPAREAIAQEDAVPTAFAVVRDDLGAAFTAEKVPKTAKLMQAVLIDEYLILDAAKDLWGRRRPFAVDSGIRPCLPQRPTGSYPSNHATIGYLTAMVLGGMLPEKRATLFESAARYAESRLTCGVHYPSDIEASKTTVALIAVKMHSNPAFQKELPEVRTELRSALGFAP